MSEEFKCPICGNVTFKFYGNYRKDKLCSIHATELKKGEIRILDHHAYLKDSDDQSLSNIPIYTNKENQILIQKLPDELIILLLRENMISLPSTGYDKCILCKEKSKGYAFCRNCYRNSATIDLFRKFLDYKTSTEKENNTNTIEELTANATTTTKNDNSVNTTENKNEEIIQENQNNVIIINEINKSKCITCGRQTDGLLFCPSCYRKYNNKELLFKITNCTNVELLDESYEGRYTCPDGHIVKSKSERDIDRYLFEKNIPHAYEIELSYGPSEREVLHPDFYLPHYLGKDKHVYIEHWGYNENNITYTNTKKFKMPIYKKLGITLICTDEKKDASKIDAVLERKLNKAFIKENEINFDE